MTASTFLFLQLVLKPIIDTAALVLVDVEWIHLLLRPSQGFVESRQKLLFDCVSRALESTLDLVHNLVVIQNQLLLLFLGLRRVSYEL